MVRFDWNALLFVFRWNCCQNDWFRIRDYGIRHTCALCCLVVDVVVVIVIVVTLSIQQSHKIKCSMEKSISKQFQIKFTMTGQFSIRYLSHRVRVTPCYVSKNVLLNVVCYINVAREKKKCIHVASVVDTIKSKSLILNEVYGQNVIKCDQTQRINGCVRYIHIHYYIMYTNMQAAGKWHKRITTKAEAAPAMEWNGLEVSTQHEKNVNIKFKVNFQ